MAMSATSADWSVDRFGFDRSDVRRRSREGVADRPSRLSAAGEIGLPASSDRAVAPRNREAHLGAQEPAGLARQRPRRARPRHEVGCGGKPLERRRIGLDQLSGLRFEVAARLGDKLGEQDRVVLRLGVEPSALESAAARIRPHVVRECHSVLRPHGLERVEPGV
jgi:hypothetical protein